MALQKSDRPAANPVAGAIAPGKHADLILLTANPLDDIRNTRQIELVIRSGVVSRPADVLKRVPVE